MHVRFLEIIRNVLVPGVVGHASSSQPARKQFTINTLNFDDVTCIYHQEIWHVYKVNC